jgi:2-oxoglutarate dehydrogenase E2 component (dihydrolipoamide succinyltransferase)
LPENAMRVLIQTPELSESVQSGTLLEWRKQVGEVAKRDEILVELETDKVILEVPAPAAGVLAAITVANGGEVKPGDPLGEIETEAGAGASAQETAPESVPAAAVPPAPPAKAEVREVPSDAPAVIQPAAPVVYPSGRADRRVTMTRLR